MNVQLAIIKGIREQLFFHDYLVLPGFGGFVLKSSPTHFSGPALLVPPSKVIGFNAQLRQNDGILASWIQKKLNCTAAEAMGHLREFAEFCSSIINTKRRLTLEGIGFFYLDFENNLCFEPQHDLNFLTGSFGLAPVLAKELEPLPEIKTETVFEDRKPASAESISSVQALSRRRVDYKRIAAPAAFVVLLFGLLLVFVSNNRISGQLRASVLGDYAGGLYQAIEYPEINLLKPETKNAAYVADANGIAVVEFEKDHAIAVKVIDVAGLNTAEGSNSMVKNHTSDSKNYQVILGCFSVLENAKKMAGKLAGQNIEATVSGRNAKGLYTVSSGSFDSKNDAIARLQNLKNDFPKAWIKNP